MYNCIRRGDWYNYADIFIKSILNLPPGGVLTSFTPCVRLCYNVLFLFAFFFSQTDWKRERERKDAGFHLLVDYKHIYGTTFTAHLTGILQMVIHSWNVIFFGEGISLMQFFHAFICLGGAGSCIKMCMYNVYTPLILRYHFDAIFPCIHSPSLPWASVFSYTHINKITA